MTRQRPGCSSWLKGGCDCGNSRQIITVLSGARLGKQVAVLGGEVFGEAKRVRVGCNADQGTLEQILLQEACQWSGRVRGIDSLEPASRRALSAPIRATMKGSGRLLPSRVTVLRSTFPSGRSRRGAGRLPLCRQ